MNNDSALIKRCPDNVSTEARIAWNIWKSITDFSEWLWDEYEQDFMVLAASEPPPHKDTIDDLPF